MKKLLFGTAALLLMASCSANGTNEKAKEDSTRIADSIAQVEEAQAAAEQARLDSIRQDSIAQEINMRLKPEVFRDYYNEKKMKKDLLNSGFKKNEYGFYDHKNLYANYPSFAINGRYVHFSYN